MIAGLRNTSSDFLDNGLMKEYYEIFDLICNRISLSDSENGRFFYCIDTDYVMDTTRGYRHENITPAYDKVLKNGIAELKYPMPKTKFEKDYNYVCDSLIALS